LLCFARVSLELEIITDADRLAEQTEAWWSLLGRSASPSPSLTPIWLLSWWSVFGCEGGRKLRAVVLRDGRRWVGFWPLLSRRVWHRPGLPFRRLEPMGSGEPEADEICSDYLGVVAERGEERRVCQRLAAVACSGALGAWDELSMPALSGEGLTPSLLCSELYARGIEVTCKPSGESPYIPLPASWDGYLAALSSERRYLVRRSLRDFERWAGDDARLEQASTPADLKRGYAILRALHEQRWSEKDQRGVFESSRFRAFHERVLPELLARGQLELLWLSVREEPIAAVYNIVFDDNVYFYQSGRKLDVPKRIRPGLVLHAYAIRRAIAAGRKTYDFLAGGSRYKKELALATRPLVELRAARPGALESARRFAELGLQRLRDWRTALASAGA
jgi:CelD/BcsL family acetyltransferase involved in cellulose biosynthesis